MSDLISRQEAIDVLRIGEELLNRVLDDMDVVGQDREKYSWGLGLIESYISDIEELPSAEPERLTDDDFETIRIHLNAYKEKLCNQRRWKEAEEYQRIIDRFMAFASSQPKVDAEPERKRGKWIPVEERFPNDENYHNFAQFPDGAVLWCTDKGIVGAGWYYESTKSWSCLDDTFPERYGNVIAWMPLPEPYRSEK